MRPILLILPVLCGCVTTAPRFPPDVAASFAHQDMRHLRTERLDVLYPADARDDALRIATTLDGCMARLHAAAGSGVTDRVQVAITTANFNNAYVTPRVAGTPLQMLLPLRLDLELFNLFDLGTGAAGDVACHEAVHYTQLEVTTGFWGAMNTVFGDVMSTNLFVESWFLEGLATYMEGRLTGAGRPHSPYFRAAFESGVAAQGGEIRAGDLNPYAREPLLYGGQYLVGAHFVEFLARRYGEERVWELVRDQGSSFFAPFGVTLRFMSVYGRTIGGLIDLYNEELRRTVTERRRPASQRTLVQGVGYLGRLASGPGGALALVAAGLDREATLSVHERDGSVRFSRAITGVVPPRSWIMAGPQTTSGLTFSRDGRFLYLVRADLAADGSTRYELARLDARNGGELDTWPVVGLGGDVTPDGAAYVYAASIGTRPALVRLDLATGRHDTLVAFEPGESISPPAISPDGRRIAFARRGPGSFDLWLREEDGTYERLTADGAFDYGPRFLDDSTVLFAREIEGRPQAVAMDVDTRAMSRVTDAPHAVLDAAPGGQGVVFLNQEGWGWTVDTAPIAASLAAPPAADPPAPVPPPPPLEVGSDEAYSALPGVLLPRSRGILMTGFVTGADGFQPVLTGWLGGTDALGLHTWAASVTYDGPAADVGFALGYSNFQLAPWLTSLDVSRVVRRRATYAGFPARKVYDEFVEEREIALTLARSLWTTNVQLGAVGLDHRDDIDPGGELRARLIGPRLAASYFGGDGTPYAGLRRGLELEGSAQLFPQELGSDFDLTDGAAGVTLHLPLPLLARQTFALGGRVRRVWGPAEGMLELGGPPFGLLYPDTTTGAPPPVFLPGYALVEPLRGFEDVYFRVNRALIGSATWTYPLIIDRGASSTLLLLPSVFLRQLEIEAFATAARTDEPRRNVHAAAGGAIRLRTAWWSMLPLSIEVQGALRSDEGLGPSWVVVLSAQ